ncbi:MAG: TRAM domain-containing protein [Candidatus Omnitrophica bacterium]|nr:TRAM domain-containing protein [Candidatus Omnitrophota bacterium]
MGKKLSTRIYTMAFGGSGIGKIDGKVCFVEGALPGEEVTFDAEKETSSYIKGRVTEVKNPSHDRVDPVCRHYRVCGGCQLQHVSYAKELAHKQQQVVELIGKIAGERDIDCCDIIASDREYNYRSSVTLHKSGTGYGYYASGSRKVIDIDECPVAAEAINAELGGLRGSKKDITLKADHLGNVWSSDRSGHRYFTDRYYGTEIVLSPKAFSQVNRHIAERIAQTLDEWIATPDGESTFFDAYCGAGFFSFVLKTDFTTRIGMDIDRVAIDCAKTTAKKYTTKNAKFYRADAAEELFGLLERHDSSRNILLIDPPRRGVEKKFLEAIGARDDIAEIYYLSCDPARLARDIKIIVDGGLWKLGRVQPFDMFPQTKHIETLVEFVKQGGRS